MKAGETINGEVWPPKNISFKKVFVKYWGPTFDLD
jgi:hypothetical protein